MDFGLVEVITKVFVAMFMLANILLFGSVDFLSNQH